VAIPQERLKMLRDKTFLCVIPARGGSKGLANKNITDFCGKPLLAWGIEHAQEAGVFDEIVVSTEDEKIKKAALKYGAKVQDRPKRLAEDSSPIREVMMFVVNNLGRTFDYVQLLEPTAPLVEGKDIKDACTKLIESGFDFLVSFTPSTAPMGVVGPILNAVATNGRMEKNVKDWFPKELRQKRRQEIAIENYQVDGNLYIGKHEIFAKGKDYWEYDVYPYAMPKEKCGHIDTELDLQLAECKWRYQHERYIPWCRNWCWNWCRNWKKYLGMVKNLLANQG